MDVNCFFCIANTFWSIYILDYYWCTESNGSACMCCPFDSQYPQCIPTQGSACTCSPLHSQYAQWIPRHTYRQFNSLYHSAIPELGQLKVNALQVNLLLLQSLLALCQGIAARVYNTIIITSINNIFSQCKQWMYRQENCCKPITASTTITVHM